MHSKVNCRPIEILLIEDSPSDANLTIKEFKKAKIANNLHWFDTGEEALEYLYQQGAYLQATRPDLILLDLNLPGMDGREILSEIKSDERFKLIPVVILTTSTDEQDVLRSYTLNANCYVSKPLDLQQFIQIIQLVGNFWLAAVRLPDNDQ